MKKIVSFVLVLALVFSLMAGMGIQSNAFSAQPIEFGNTINSAVIGTTDDYYFNVNETGNVSISVVSESGISVIIYDNNYNLLYDLTFQYTYNAIRQYVRTCSVQFPKGLYYVRIEANYSWVSANYTLCVNYKPKINVPSILKCTARSTNAQKVAWNKVAGVTGYQVQCSNGGTKWAQTKVTTGNTALFTGLIAGGKYKFRVRAYKRIDGINYFSAWSPVLNSCAKPANVILKGVSSPKHTQIKAAWSKAGGVVTGYQIVYSRNKAFTSLAAIKNVSAKTLAYTGKNFTKGRTYYLAVRAYTTFAGKVYYGKYSAIKAVKCK